MGDELLNRLHLLLSDAHAAAIELRVREAAMEADGTYGPGNARSAELAVVHIEDALLRVDTLGRFS